MDFEMDPHGVTHANTSMHHSREQVAALLPMLEKALAISAMIAVGSVVLPGRPWHECGRSLTYIRVPRSKDLESAPLSGAEDRYARRLLLP